MEIQIKMDSNVELKSNKNIQNNNIGPLGYKKDSGGGSPKTHPPW